MHGCLDCPMCGKELLDYIVVVWGAFGQRYELGEPIKWFRCKGSLLTPNSYFVGGYINGGDPKLKVVYAFDQIEYYPHGGGRCHHCDQGIGGVAAKIIDGIYEDLVVFNQTEINCLFGAGDQDLETLVSCGDTLIPYDFPDFFPWKTLPDLAGVTLAPEVFRSEENDADAFG